MSESFSMDWSLAHKYMTSAPFIRYLSIYLHQSFSKMHL